MSVPTGFDSRDAVAANPSVTNPPWPLRASRSQNNPVNCGFLDKPALLWTNRCGWPRNTALGPESDHNVDHIILQAPRPTAANRSAGTCHNAPSGARHDQDNPTISR